MVMVFEVEPVESTWLVKRSDWANSGGEGLGWISNIGDIEERMDVDVSLRKVEVQ